MSKQLISLVFVLLSLEIVGAIISEVKGKVVGLSRFAVKGLGPDCLKEVSLSVGDAFPLDRQWALLDVSKSIQFDQTSPVWIHKQNFLCAFTAAERLRHIVTSLDDATGVLTICRRELQALGGGDSRRSSLDDDDIIFQACLNEQAGRECCSSFFSEFWGRSVELVGAPYFEKKGPSPKPSKISRFPPHQFGNTQSGVKEDGDTRTVHIINAATVRNLAEAAGLEDGEHALDPMRFRPNIVVDEVSPWAEFDWVGSGNPVCIGDLELTVISKTIRCQGVNIDPMKPAGQPLDITNLLMKNFPEYGPYLGVYAKVTKAGVIRLGDALSI